MRPRDKNEGIKEREGKKRKRIHEKGEGGKKEKDNEEK